MAEQDRIGRIKVQPDLTIPGHPEISVVGDAMSLGELPGVAEVAMHAGVYAAWRIRSDISGLGDRQPFRYSDLGSAAYIARGQAVIEFHGWRASGLVGWIGWLLIHITFLTGFRNRAGATIAWLVTFSRESRRERAFAMPRPRAALDEQTLQPQR